MKTLHLIHGLQLGGIAALVIDLALASQTCDDQVKVIAVSRDPSLEIELRYPACFDGRLNFSCLNKPAGKGVLKATQELRRQLLSYKPEIVVVHHEHLLPMIGLASINLPCVFFQVIHNQKLDKVRLHRWIGKRFYKTYIFVSEAARVNGIEQLDLKYEKTRTIINGIDLRSYRSALISKAPSFLFVGRLNHQKNLPGLLERYASYSKLTSHKPLPLTIVGKGEEEASLREIILQYHLEGLVTIQEASGSIADVYCQHTCLLLPSHYEGTPMVILEAMASGLVVIANDVGGVASMMIHEKQGFVIDPLDKETFVKTMVLVAENQNLSKQISVAARQKALSFDISMTAKHYRKVFDEHLKKKSNER